MKSENQGNIHHQCIPLFATLHAVTKYLVPRIKLQKIKKCNSWWKIVAETVGWPTNAARKCTSCQNCPNCLSRYNNSVQLRRIRKVASSGKFNHLLWENFFLPQSMFCVCLAQIVGTISLLLQAWDFKQHWELHFENALYNANQIVDKNTAKNAIQKMIFCARWL